MVILLVAGGAYCGGRLALAHSRPPQVVDTTILPEAIVCAHKDLRAWIPGTGVTVLADSPYIFKANFLATELSDPLSDPQLHAFEESCNQNGVYPSQQDGGLEFELKIGDTNLYSSLNGVQRLEAPASPVPDYSQAELQKLGWQGDVPLWVLLKPAALRGFLPSGLEWSDQVKALEAKLWPSEQRGQFVFHMDAQFVPPVASTQLDLATAWKQLPAARSMMCLRKEFLSALLCRKPSTQSLQSPGHMAQRILASADHWVGLSLGQELHPETMQKTWEQMGKGWIPMALWSDFPVQQASSSQYFEVQTNQFGTLFSLGVNPTPGTATAPWESRDDESAKDWSGAGHFEMPLADGTRRVEWVAHCQDRQLIFEFQWSPAASLAAHQEIETMGPDLETLYTPHPNVIAGR